MIKTCSKAETISSSGRVMRTASVGAVSRRGRICDASWDDGKRRAVVRVFEANVRNRRRCVLQPRRDILTMRESTSYRRIKRATWWLQHDNEGRLLHVWHSKFWMACLKPEKVEFAFVRCLVMEGFAKNAAVKYSEIGLVYFCVFFPNSRRIGKRLVCLTLKIIGSNWHVRSPRGSEFRFLKEQVYGTSSVVCGICFRLRNLRRCEEIQCLKQLMWNMLDFSNYFCHLENYERASERNTIKNSLIASPSFNACMVDPIGQRNAKPLFIQNHGGKGFLQYWQGLSWH